MATAVVLCSAGINSAVAARKAAATHDVHLLHVDLGQPAAERQRSAVSDLAHVMEVPVKRAVLPPIADVGFSDDDPAARRCQATRAGNTLALLAVGVQFATAVHASSIVLGSSEVADETECGAAPGCGTASYRREVTYLYQLLLEQLLGDARRITVQQPLAELARADIIRLGDRLNTPFDLTYSCDAAGPAPCGACHGCATRSAAFQNAGLLDPALSASR